MTRYLTAATPDAAMRNGEYEHKLKPKKTVLEHEAVGWRGWSRIGAKTARVDTVKRAQLCGRMEARIHPREMYVIPHRPRCLALMKVDSTEQLGGDRKTRMLGYASAEDDQDLEDLVGRNALPRVTNSVGLAGPFAKHNYAYAYFCYRPEVAKYRSQEHSSGLGC